MNYSNHHQTSTQAWLVERRWILDCSKIAIAVKLQVMKHGFHSVQETTRAQIFKRLLKAVLILAIGTLLVYIPAVTVAFVSDQKTRSDRYAAILISAHALAGNDYWLPPIAFLGSYPAWTLYFNARGLKPDYFLGATYKDFVNVLQDERYQSIVLVGHGSYNHWRATDQEVSIFDIERLEGTFTKKAGEWFQLTCGNRELSDVQLGEPVMHSGRPHAYSSNAYALHFIIDALTPFWMIKSATERRYSTRNN